MASFEIMDRFEIHKNVDFLSRADECIPRLIEKEVVGCVTEGKAGNLKKGDRVIYDFGNHYVGYVNLKLSASGSHPDAPAFIKLKFAEKKQEFNDNSEDYDGWISRSWIQEEWIHVDVLPKELKLSRRYAFRYLLIEVIDTSQKYRLNVDSVCVNSVSCVSMEDIELKDYKDDMLNDIARVSAYTLKECMQQVFEDGPKRDRRLWLGDLRLQAKANYVTFKNYDLVKRCLYLFAGLPFNEDKISACLFTEPDYEPDDTFLLDYSLFFICTLQEYYENSEDLETIKELYPIAIKQIDNAEHTLDSKAVVVDQGDRFWCFIDWSEGLNKQAAAQAIFIYAVGYAIKLAEVLNDSKEIYRLNELKKRLIGGAKRCLWDDDKQLFVSGADKQISKASQIWMILAGVLDEEEAYELLERMNSEPAAIGMVTPYMYHYYIEALLYANKREEALNELRKIWVECFQMEPTPFGNYTIQIIQQNHRMDRIW